jgi:hypothetical protein
MGNDPFADDVVLLLMMEGEDGSTTFIDTGTGARTITRSGTCVISTAEKYSGSSSYLGNVNSRLDFPEVVFPGDFTVEMFLRATSLSGIRAFTGHTGGNRQMRLSPNLFVYYDGASICNRTPTQGAPLIDTWYHFAWTREGTLHRVFWNGVEQSSLALGGNIALNVIGAGYVGGNQWPGYIDAVRFTAACRYTEDFEMPDGVWIAP